MKYNVFTIYDRTTIQKKRPTSHTQSVNDVGHYYENFHQHWAQYICAQHGICCLTYWHSSIVLAFVVQAFVVPVFICHVGIRRADVCHVSVCHAGVCHAGACHAGVRCAGVHHVGVRRVGFCCVGVAVVVAFICCSSVLLVFVRCAGVCHVGVCCAGIHLLGWHSLVVLVFVDGVKMWTLTPNTNQPVARRGVVIVILIEWCLSSNLTNRKIWCQSVPTYNQGLEHRQT